MYKWRALIVRRHTTLRRCNSLTTLEMTSRRRCSCLSQGCRDHRQGFRVLDAKEYRAHQKADAAFPVQVKEPLPDTDQLLSSIQGALNQYKEVDFPFTALTFRTEVDTLPIASARTVLLPDNPVNRSILDYEEWHEGSITLLHDISKATPNCQIQIASLVQDLSTFYAHMVSKIEVQLGLSLNFKNKAQPTSSYPPSLLESEILYGVKTYRYIASPSPLANQNLYPISNHQPSHRSYSPNAQLRWIDKMINELSGQGTMSSLRREELLEGLEEHRGNVTADLDCELIQRRFPYLTVRAIIKSTLVA